MLYIIDLLFIHSHSKTREFYNLGEENVFVETDHFRVDVTVNVNTVAHVLWWQKNTISMEINGQIREKNRGKVLVLLAVNRNAKKSSFTFTEHCY